MNKKTEKNKNIKFDGKKLRKIFEEKKVNMAGLSRELGYSDTYLSYCLNSGTMAPIVMKFLEAKFDIESEDYEIDTEPEVEVVKAEVAKPEIPEDSIFNMTKEEFSEMIYKAMYSAVKHAWSDV